MTLRRYMFREVLRRPGRTVLTLVGIVIGVQALVAIPLAIESTRDTHRELYEGLAGHAALEVVPSGAGGFAAELAVQLEALEDVEAAVPVIQSTAMIATRTGVMPIMTLGIGIARIDQAREYTLRSGSMLSADGQVLLDGEFAVQREVGLGEDVILLTPSGSVSLRIVGLLARTRVSAVNAGGVAIIPLTTAQRLYRLEGLVNSVGLVLAAQADHAAVADSVRALLPPGLTVQVPAARAALAQGALLNTERMLAILSIVSLVAGAFVILNSFLMSVSERRRSLAVLRALGATRKQVVRLLMAEAAALGAMGTLIGIPIGVGGAFVMTQLMARMAGPVTPQFSLSPGPFLLAAVLGPGVAMIATFHAARRAGWRPPLAELRERPSGAAEEGRLRRWPGALGLTMLGLFAVFYVLVTIRRMPADLFMILLPIGMTLLLVGCALIIPMVVLPLSHLVEKVLRPVIGFEASLAVRHLRRHRTRSSLVVGVLMISLILSIGYGNAIHNSVRDLRDWMARIVDRVDFMVVPTPLSGTGLFPVSMPEAYAETIGSFEGVRFVGKGAILSSRIDGRTVMVFARSCRPGEDPGIRLAQGEPESAYEAFRQGGVLLGTTLAHHRGVKRGDQVAIETREGTTSFRIAGLTTDYGAGGMVAFLEWAQGKRYLNVEGAQYLYIATDPLARAAVDERLQSFCAEHHLEMHSRAGFIQKCDEMIAGVIGSSWVLLAMVFVVASLGLTNCLTMNVLEQTRELGILRAVALKRRQLCKMIVSEALAVGLIGAVPGVVFGVLLGYLVTEANEPIVGIRIPYVLEPTLLAGSVVIALVLAVLASLGPARRAGRLTIIRALQYE